MHSLQSPRLLYLRFGLRLTWLLLCYRLRRSFLQLLSCYLPFGSQLRIL